jgi:flagellar hook protein FlgE
MMRSLYSGVAGLKSQQTGMDVVGNNIANVNTNGFKSGRATFQDTLNQTLSGASSPTGTTGGTNPKQIGLGVGVGTIDTLFTDGSIQSTGKNTDLCLSGQGLFIVNDGTNSYYTRNGAFQFDAKGNYVMPGSGLLVQGWMGNNTSTVDTNGTIGNIQIQAGKTMAAKATTTATYSKNLSANAATIATMTLTLANGSTVTVPATDTTSYKIGDTNGASTIASMTLNMSDSTTKSITTGTTGYANGSCLPITTTIAVYDSLGTAHTVPVVLTKASSNTWNLSPATQTLTDGTVATLTSTALKFTNNGAYTSGTASLALTYTDGAAAGAVAVDLTGLTQYAGESNVSADADGYTAGTLKSVSIDSSGIITGTYTNSQKVAEAQVAVATCNNPSGLTKSGSSLYSASNNSGTVTAHTVSASGSSLTPSALEMSNVDLASEFSTMIVTQRGFQSNSKIITVSDEMIETLVNMKR